MSRTRAPDLGGASDLDVAQARARHDAGGQGLEDGVAIAGADSGRRLHRSGGFAFGEAVAQMGGDVEVVLAFE